MFSRSIPDYDVVIVGARVAGAATALNLARGGARVLVVDRDPAGSDTLSTHALMRAGVALLDRWGVLPALVAAGTPPIRETIFDYGTESVTVDIQPRGGAEGLFAPRRALLDGVLIDAAAAAGATVLHGVRCEGVLRDGAGCVTGIEIRRARGLTEKIRAGLVIGADGRNSTVARHVGAEIHRAGRNRSATVYGYFDAPPQAGYRWIFRPGLEAGAIPTNDGQCCIFASVAPDRFRETFGADPLGGMRAILARSDAQLADIVAAGPAERLHRFGGVTGHFRHASGLGWALVGDAGYFKDPCTAHGITDALRDAEILSRAILSDRPGALADYERTRDLLSGDLFEVTDRIAGLDWTIPELQKLHARLNRAMKAEQAYLDADEAALAA